ncbi:MAG: SH3 domain-containing protein [Mesobacillus sp.]|uniref:SH3 domain-containing protein n=1 Tax=Mesobacillus sp. TaxID=2675271 RepID=UPI003C357BFC
MSRLERKQEKRSSFKGVISKGMIASSILVSSSLLLPEIPFIPSGAPVVKAAGPTYTVTADVLNVRSGAGTNYSRIGRLVQGTQLQVIQQLSNGWYKISFNGKTGYVSGDYVYTPSVVFKVTATNLNVRTGPGTQYQKIGSVVQGTVLNVIHKESNGWMRISFNGKTAYVSGQYVSSSNGAAYNKMNIPVIAQRPELPSGCEVTSLAMALRYYGVNVDKTVLAKQMPYDSTKLVRNADGSIKVWGDPNVGFVGTPFGNGYTINPVPLKKVLDQYRPGGIALTGKNFSEIERYISQGKPVLVWFTINYEMPKAREWKTPAGKTINAARPLHNVVITGTDANYVYFNDSEAVKKDVKIPKAKFINIYNAMGKRALVVN